MSVIVRPPTKGVVLEDCWIHEIHCDCQTCNRWQSYILPDVAVRQARIDLEARAFQVFLDHGWQIAPALCKECKELGHDHRPATDAGPGADRVPGRA
jgi:hypothetical protein